MNQIGKVEKNIGKMAEVRIQRPSACGENCSSCKGGCTPTERVVSAVNEAGAEAGERVELEMKSSYVLGAALLVYIIPLVTMFIGYGISGIFFHNEIYRIIVGFAVMALCYVIVSGIDKKLKNKYVLIIKRVLR